MLQMKKNTKTKIGTLAASALALASVLGLVHQSLPNAAAAQPTTTVATTLVQPATAASNSTGSTRAAIATPTSAAVAAAESVKAAPTTAVTARTRVS